MMGVYIDKGTDKVAASQGKFSDKEFNVRVGQKHLEGDRVVNIQCNSSSMPASVPTDKVEAWYEKFIKY